MSKLLVGADPELFFKRDSKFISIIGLLGGSKFEPLDIGKGCAVQEDNVAAEFNIPPAENADAFVESIQYNLDYLTQKAKAIGATLALEASAVFPESELKTPASWIFGCEPDFDAWALKVNDKPKSVVKELRSAVAISTWPLNKIKSRLFEQWICLLVLN